MPPPPGLQLQVGVVSFVGVVPDTLGAVGAVGSVGSVVSTTTSFPSSSSSGFLTTTSLLQEETRNAMLTIKTKQENKFFKIIFLEYVE